MKTLGDYRHLCKLVGFDKALRYFQNLIDISPNGENEVVVQDMSQVMYLIAMLEDKKD